MLCTATVIAVTIATKTATITCNEGHKITTTVVVGAKKTPTPVGQYKIYDISDVDGYGPVKTMAVFKPYTLGEDGNDRKAVGSVFAFHGDEASLSRESMGCVRFNDQVMAQVKFVIGTKVVIVRK